MEVFILKGYAGTGKTSLVKSIIKSLPALKFKSLLLAPTGRAAKVLGSYSDKRAFTIHSKIYKMSTNAFGGIFFSPAANTQTDTLFIVDEASMIHGEDREMKTGGMEATDVLADLLEHVFSGENCKLLIIGDTAQLPPVGLNLSPALDADFLQQAYHLNKISVTELTEVARQSSGSNILAQATRIRQFISDDSLAEELKILAKDDVENLDNETFLDNLNSSYGKQGFDESVIITRSNKRANQYNIGIRARVLYREDEIGAGDILMVVRNNYFWLPPESKAGFIANGDFVEVQRIKNFREMHGHRFADATLRMLDYPDDSPVECTLLLDVLALESANLGWTESKALYESVSQDYMEILDKRKRALAIRQDKYLNALQVKFGYAITCHKAQGGQWNHVYLDHGWLGENFLTKEFYRWLYTGVTRAKQKLYLVNFAKALVE